MADRFLTLDIDTDGITACIVKHVSKKSYIKNICRIPYESLPETDTAETLFESALTCLEDHMDMKSFSFATLLLPSSSVSFRTIELPFKSAGKIKQILPLEIASHLPAPDETYISDFQILDIPCQKSQTPVFAASVMKSDIENFIESLRKYGIKPKIIIPKGYASAICILGENPSIISFICLDLDIHENTVTIVYNKKPVFVRSFPVSPDTPEALADTARQALLVFRQQTGLDACFDLFITASEQFKGLTKKSVYGLENFLHYQTQFYPADDNTPRHKLELKKLNRTNLMAALHPGHKKGSFINFYTPQTGFAPVFRKNIKTLATTAFLSCILFACSLYNLHLEIRDLNEQIDIHGSKADLIYKTTFPDQKKARYPLLQMQSLVKKAVRESTLAKKNEPTFKRPAYKATKIMAALSDSIPGTIDMEISSFFLNQSTLVISGTTDNFKNVDRIKGLIEKKNLFKQVSINSASVDKKTNTIRFKFTIKL